MTSYLQMMKKELVTDTSNKNIQIAYRNGILHRKMSYDPNEKLEKTNKKNNKTEKCAKQQVKRKITNTWE